MDIELLNPQSAAPSIEIVAATVDDIDWIDGLQKKHSDRVGFHPRMTLEGKIAQGQIIVARSANGDRPPIGYCMASDRYMKREDCGIIYQMNVEPGRQRASIGAALLKAQFERSAYGCRLYCCWCAQDIEANRFWEAMGFVALAYRAGSEKRKGGRTHIFWQTRVREEDRTTPWWYPSQTQGGSMEDRLVFPIVPGTHWSEAKPLILPGQEVDGLRLSVDGKKDALLMSSTGSRRPKARSPKAALPVAGPTPVIPKRMPLSGGLMFAVPVVPQAAVATAIVAASAEVSPIEKARPRRVKAKNDPKFVAAARELRDRYLEQVNDGRLMQGPRKRVTLAIAGVARQPLLLAEAA